MAGSEGGSDDFCFFQAEDGIRDVAVTGVQTCALPIWPRGCDAARQGRLRRTKMAEHTNRTFICSVLFLDIVDYSLRSVAEQIALKERFNAEIGRASCRARV